MLIEDTYIRDSARKPLGPKSWCLDIQPTGRWSHAIQPSIYNLGLFDTFSPFLSEYDNFCTATTQIH